MFDNAERKLERLNSGIEDNISTQTYNIIIGAMIVYGLLVNAIIVAKFADVFVNMNPIALIVGYFVCCIAGTVIAHRSNNPAMSFLGYSLVVLPIGALMSTFVPSYYVQDIKSAALVTGVIVIVMTGVATAKPQWFSGLGTTLFISLILGLVGQLIAMLLGYAGNIFNWFFVIIFSLYVGYDWMKAQAYPKTVDNAIDSSLDIYLDIINLFIRLLAIFGGRGRSRR